MPACRCVDARQPLRRCLPTAAPCPPVAASMPANRCSMPASHCSLPASHCSLPAGHSSLPAGHSSLSAGHCFLSAGHSSLPASSLRARLVSARSCRSSLSFADVVYAGCVRQLYPPLAYAGFPDLLPACASYSDCPPTPPPLVSAPVIVRPCSLVGFVLSQAMLSVGVEAGDALLAYGCGSRNTLLNRIIMSQIFACSKKIITFVCLSRTRYPRI